MLQLNPSIALEYALHRGLAEIEDIISGTLEIVPIPGRNNNYAIRLGPKGGFFLKQPRTPSPEATELVLREASFGVIAATDPRFIHLRQAVTRVVRVDVENLILITELVSNPSKLSPSASDKDTLSQLGAALGKQLSMLHRLGRDSLRDAAWLSPQIPWIFDQRNGVSHPIYQLGSAGHYVASIIQKTQSLRTNLRLLRNCWTASTLIHGDLKVDNILFCPTDMRLYLVDWELATLGEPLWDVACTVVGWQTAAVAEATTNDDRIPDLSSLLNETSSLRCLICSFLGSYFGNRLLSSWESLVRMCSARLLVAATELILGSGSISNTSQLLLELADRSLTQPELVLPVPESL